MFESISVTVAIVLCIPALLLALQRSTWLIDYLFLIVAINRCIRRIVDYHNGYFNPFSVISLTPMIVGGLTVLVVLSELNSGQSTLGQRVRRVLYLYGGLISYAFVVGFLNAKFAAVYALGDYIAPIGLIGYGALAARDTQVINRWCVSFALTVLIVAVYGLWQFYTIPAWDAFWLVSVDFVGYMGVPEPTKMTLFSTMSERGPAAIYLCYGLMLLVLRPNTLGMFSWPAAAVVFFAMALTYSRTTIIFAGLAVVLYPMLNRGAGAWSVVGILLLVLIVGPRLVDSLPGRAFDRIQSIGTIQEDNSFLGRLKLLQISLQNSITQPFGLGIGAGGLAKRVQAATQAVVSDSTGYAKTLATYGWVGFGIMVAILLTIWRATARLVAMEADDETIRIFRAWFIAGLVALFSGDWLVGASFFWLLAGYSLGCDDAIETEPEEPDREHSENDYSIPQHADYASFDRPAWLN